MVKAAYVDKNGVKKGAWSAEEDEKLRSYVLRYGHWNWRLLPKFAGLERCGKSCRLRWMNYLKSGIKRGNYTREERDVIEKLHHEHGNKWSVIAAKLPGRTDNDIKNFWHTHLRSRETTSKSISQEKHSSEVGDCKNLENNAFSPKSCSRKLGKSKVSSDELFILESSSSNMASSEVSATVDSDLDSSTDKNFPEMSLSATSRATDDFLSEFDESFWTQPFMVDTYSYKCDYSFSLLDEAIPLSSMF